MTAGPILASTLIMLLAGGSLFAFLRYRRARVDMGPAEFFVRLVRGQGFATRSAAWFENVLAAGDPDPILVDLRKRRTETSEILPGAVITTFDDFLRNVVVDGRYPNRHIPMVLVCDTGHLSRVVADYLANEEGYTAVTNIRGGMEAINDHRRRVARGNRCCPAVFGLGT